MRGVGTNDDPAGVLGMGFHMGPRKAASAQAGPARRPKAEVPAGGSGVGLAVRVRLAAVVTVSANWAAGAASCLPVLALTGCRTSGAVCRAEPGDSLPYISAQLRDAPGAARHRPADDPGVARPRELGDDYDLPARGQQGAGDGYQSPCPFSNFR